MGHYSSFIVRLWVDPPEGFRWGVVQHVGSQQEQRFNTLQDMLDFMLLHTDTVELSIPFSLDSGTLLSGRDGKRSAEGAKESTGKRRQSDQKEAGHARGAGQVGEAEEAEEVGDDGRDEPKPRRGGHIGAE